MEIRDAVVVVTGAASGIGEAMVERFASEGCNFQLFEGKKVLRVYNKNEQTA